MLSYAFHYINLESLSFHPVLNCSVVTNASMNHQNQSHPVQLVAKFTAFPAMNSPSYSSRMVSTLPATSSSIVGLRRLLWNYVVFGVYQFLKMINGRVRKIVFYLMHPNYPQRRKYCNFIHAPCVSI